MANVGDEVLIRGKVQELLEPGDQTMVRIRLADGNDVWVSRGVLYELHPPNGKRRGGAEPLYTFHRDIERTLDLFGQAGALSAEVADYLKRCLIVGEDRAGPRPLSMESPVAMSMASENGQTDEQVGPRSPAAEQVSRDAEEHTASSGGGGKARAKK